jgi:hypothetical protein
MQMTFKLRLLAQISSICEMFYGIATYYSKMDTSSINDMPLDTTSRIEMSGRDLETSPDILGTSTLSHNSAYKLKTYS